MAIKTGDQFYDDLADLTTGFFDWLAPAFAGLVWLGVLIPIKLIAKAASRQEPASDAWWEPMPGLDADVGLQPEGEGLLLGESLND